MVLHFVFLAKKLLVPHQCFSDCLASSLSLSCSAFPVSWLGCTRSWEGTKPGQQTQTDQRTSHTLRCHTQQKAENKEEDRGSFIITVRVFPSSQKDAEALFYREWLLMGSSKWIVSLSPRLRVQLLLSLLNCNYLHLRLLTFSPSQVKRGLSKLQGTW